MVQRVRSFQMRCSVDFISPLSRVVEVKTRSVETLKLSCREVDKNSNPSAKDPNRSSSVSSSKASMFLLSIANKHILYIYLLYQYRSIALKEKASHSDITRAASKQYEHHGWRVFFPATSATSTKTGGSESATGFRLFTASRTWRTWTRRG
jgi:hypothetical protein